MTPLDDLIAYHRKMEQEYREEAERALTFKDEGLSRRAHKQWSETMRIARDTASWLATIRARG